MTKRKKFSSKEQKNTHKNSDLKIQPKDILQKSCGVLYLFLKKEKVGISYTEASATST